MSDPYFHKVLWALQAAHCQKLTKGQFGALHPLQGLLNKDLFIECLSLSNEPLTAEQEAALPDEDDATGSTTLSPMTGGPSHNLSTFDDLSNLNNEDLDDIDAIMGDGMGDGMDIGFGDSGIMSSSHNAIQSMALSLTGVNSGLMPVDANGKTTMSVRSYKDSEEDAVKKRNSILDDAKFTLQNTVYESRQSCMMGMHNYADLQGKKIKVDSSKSGGNRFIMKCCDRSCPFKLTARVTTEKERTMKDNNSGESRNIVSKKGRLHSTRAVHFTGIKKPNPLHSNVTTQRDPLATSDAASRQQSSQARPPASLQPSGEHRDIQGPTALDSGNALHCHWKMLTPFTPL